MRIRQAEAYKYQLQFRPLLGGDISNAPTMSSGARRDGLLIRITLDNGQKAWGEIAPLEGRSIETLNTAEEELKGVFRALIERDIPRNWSEMVSMAPATGCSASVAFGIEQTLSELASGLERTPTPLWIRAESRSSVTINALFSGTRASVTAEAAARRAEGFTVFKMKVGDGNPDDIRQSVQAVREVVGRKASLRLDANRAWTFDHAAEVLRGVEDLDISYVEEPLMNPADLERLSAETVVPIAIDETVLDLCLKGFSSQDYCFLSAAILKPTIVGGMIRTMALAAKFADAGIEPVITSAFESEVGLLGLYGLAAALPGAGWAAGLDTQRAFFRGVLTDDEGGNGSLSEAWFRKPSHDATRDVILNVDRARLVKVYQVDA